MVDGGAYADGTTDYTTMISEFKAKKGEIFSNCPLPPDFNTFWKQAVAAGLQAQAGHRGQGAAVPGRHHGTRAAGQQHRHRLVVGAVHALHLLAERHVGQVAGRTFQSSTGNEWVQSIGSSYALFEVAKEAFGAVSDPHDKAEVANALHNVNYTGMNGPINFADGPAPGVGIVQPVGAQWKTSTGKYPFEINVVDNSINPTVPIGAELVPTNA